MCVGGGGGAGADVHVHMNYRVEMLLLFQDGFIPDAFLACIEIISVY